MVRRSKQFWMFLSVILATSTWTEASPLPTSEPESTTFLTTEMVMATTSSTIIAHHQENANLSSISTLPPAEVTIFPESDLYSTTEYTQGGDNIVINPMISEKPSISSEIPQGIRLEQVALTKDSMTQLLNVSSHPTNRDQSELVNEEVETTTALWSSSTLVETSTFSQDVYAGTGLYMNVSEPKITIEAEVSPNVTNVTDKSASAESLKSIGASKNNTEDILTNAPDLTVTGEYSTTEEISTNILPTEKTPHLETVDFEVPKQFKEVTTQSTKEIAKLTQEMSQTDERVRNFTKEFATSTEEGVKRTEESAVHKPTEEAAKQTEEDASLKSPGEIAEHTEEAVAPNKTTQVSKRLEEYSPVTTEVSETREEVKNFTDGAAELTEEFETQTREESKPTEKLLTDVAVSSANKSTRPEIFISSGYNIPMKTYSSPSLDNPRGSRHFAEETSEPKYANGTESQPEINTPKSILTSPQTNASFTQPPETTPTSEQPKPLTPNPLQNNSAVDVNSTEPSPTGQSTSDITPSEINALNATSPNATEEPITITSQHYSNTPQPITPRELSVNTGAKKQNVSVSSVAQEFPSKSDEEFTPAITGLATDSPPSPKSSQVVVPQSTVEDSKTSLFIHTSRASSPSSVSLESGVRNVEKATGGANRSIECSPEPAVSVFQGDLRYIIVLGLTGCSVAATLLLVTLVLVRLRESKQRDTSPSLQICGCLGRTQRAEITPRRAEVSEVKLRPGCNLATDADCRAGEGEDVPLALSAGTQKVSAPPTPVSMTVKPNGAPPLPPKPGDSPV